MPREREYLSTDPDAGTPVGQEYLSTDPDAGTPLIARARTPARGDEMTAIDRTTGTLRAVPGVPPEFGSVVPPEPTFIDRLLTRLRGAQLPGGKTPVAPGAAVNPKTGLPIPEAPLGSVPVLDAPAVGLPQVARGVRDMLASRSSDAIPVPSGIPGLRLRVPGQPDEAMNAASDVMEGAFKAGEPLMAGAAVTNPVATLAMLGIGMAGQKGAEKTAEVLGGSPATSRFAGNLGALVTGGLGVKGGHGLEARLRAAVEKKIKPPVPVAEAARPQTPPPPREAPPPEATIPPVEPQAVRPPEPAVRPQEAPDVPLPIDRAEALDVREPPRNGAPVGVRDAGQEAPGARLKEEAPPVGPRPAAEEAVVGVSPRGHAVDTSVETRLPVAEIVADPQRFQFKQNVDKAGVRPEDRLTEAWNPDKAGVLLVWRDPADGQTYVVNGHHRLDLAKRAGQPDVLARYVEAPDATAAMVKGAEVNIAEGRGTAVDAGRMFRAMSPERRADTARHAKTPVARDGLSLANLTDEAFRQVAVGEMPLARGLAIGRAQLAPAEEASLLKLLAAQDAKGRTVSEATIRELAAEVKQAPTIDVTGTGEQRNIFEDLLGDQTIANTAFERARVRAALQERLARDQRLFGYVTKGDRAERLAGAGKTTIDVEAAGQRAAEAGTIADVFSRLANTKGPINDAINAAAESLAKGGRYRDLEADLYARVRDAVDVELRSGPPQPPAEGPGLRGSPPAGGGPGATGPAPAEGRTGPVAGKPAPPLPVRARSSVLSEFPKTEKPAPPVPVKPTEAETILSEMKATTDQAAPPVAEVPFALAREAKKVEPVQNDLLARIQSVEDAARDRLKKRGTFSGNRVSSGLPVDDMADLAVIGAAKIAKGAVQFSQWSAEMVREFGEVIKPHLQALYKEARLKAESFGPMPIYAPSGRDLPPTKAIPAVRRLEFPSIQKMPEPIRQDIADLMERYEGFEAQRRGVQTWERTEERAKDVWLPLETLKPGRAVNAEELASYKNAIATALTQRKPLLEKLKDGSATDWDRLQASHLTDVATVLTASYRGAKAEAGRALNILRAKARVLDLQESAFLEAALKAPGFEADLTRISKAALDAAGDPIAQLRLLRQRSGTWFDYVQAAYYTNLLSGVKTQLRNIIGNSFNLAANTLVPITAAPADAVLARKRGMGRNVYLGEIPHATAGAWIGLGRGARNALFVLRHGFRPSTVEAASEGKFDTLRVELPGGVVTNWPTRLLEGMDEFFRAVARQQELHAGAYAQARREGLTKSNEISARMSELFTATDPRTPDGKIAADLFRRADTVAARSVFQEDPGPIVQWLLKAKSPDSPLSLRAASMFLAPFVKTPGAILRQGAEWSPAGFIMRGVRKGEGREQSQAIGRAALGSALLLSEAYLAANGLLTGAPPHDPGEREEFYAQGKLSNAVRIGPFWVRYSLFQPFSVGMAAVANAWESFKQSEMDEAAAEEAAVAAVAGAGASILDQSVLAGMGTLIDAVNDPQRSGGRWLSLFVQGLVPGSGLLRNITQATDPTFRKPTGVVQSVKTIVPGLSTDVPPRRNRFGEPATRPGSWLTRGFVVPEISRAVEDDITATLARLDVRPQVPRAQFTVKGRKVQMTAEQQDVVVEAIGRERKARIEYAIRSAVFGSMTEDQRRSVLKRALDDAGETVRARVLNDLNAGRALDVSRLVSDRTRESMAREKKDFQALVEGREHRP